MIRATCYGRVSSDRQERESTVQSQLEELRQRIEADGVLGHREFVDEGYARDNLVRPELDKLRDLIAAGELDRIYVQSPDRLASGAKLVLLVEEFQLAGVEVVFLKGAVEDTPEGKLLLHMQGAIGEYERTKIAERTRRGKLYWARQGVMVGGRAPYGYKHIRRNEVQRARLEIDEYQASVVRRIYQMLAEEQRSTRSVAMALSKSGIPTPRGAHQWQPTSVDRILRNPAYKGTFYYLRTEAVEPSRRTSADTYQRRRKTGKRPRPQEEWIAVPVPPIVDDELWERAQEQLKLNSQHSRRNNTRHQYLLRGLIKCPRCGHSYTGAAQHGSRRYRCTNTDSSISSTGKRCNPGSISADLLEREVWGALSSALRQPKLLREEYGRRLAGEGSGDALDAERKQLEGALKRVKSQEDRVTDAYVNEAMDLVRYKAEMEKLKASKLELGRAVKETERRKRTKEESKKAIDSLDRFCQTVSQGLDNLTFEDRQQLLRLVVERITVDEGRVVIESVIPTGGDDGQLRARCPEALEGRAHTAFRPPPCHSEPAREDRRIWSGGDSTSNPCAHYRCSSLTYLLAQRVPVSNIPTDLCTHRYTVPHS